MKDLGYLLDVVTLIHNIYSHSTTIFNDDQFGHTKPIPIQAGTIQANTLSPYLFPIYLEPLFKWLQSKKNGYTFAMYIQINHQYICNLRTRPNL